MPPAIDLSVKPKKIVFDDDGEVLSEVKVKSKNKKKKLSTSEETPEAVDGEEDVASENGQIKNEDEEEEEDFFSKEEKLKKKQNSNSNNEANKKWFEVYPQFPSTEEILDIKEKEQTELFNICKAAYEAELPRFVKRNPSDSKWLLTAIHKGTSKDRANAGALLVTSNPVGNLQTLETLIGFTKMSNKACTEVISILTDLVIEVLLPAHRKLLSIQMRAADWKVLKKDESLSKEQQRKIFAYWYFENELKDQYFEFLKNLQQNLQTGQENNKTTSIVAASRLLTYSPEKEQMLLTMLINKLGDPVPKVASKALHHLSEVAYKHPNMCGVITAETEKLLFRNNISERAQHFGLCFLAQIAPSGRPEVCTKLVNICFALFKVLVKKGAINNRTMQAILRCLQKAIVEAKPADGSTEIMTKDMQDTIYRLVHLADIRISIQTLSLLLQLITVKTEKSDRFYNALYKKMLDIELTTIGNKTAAHFLHIVHRAIHIDTHVSRAQAFIKRLLQMSLYFPAAVAAGCLIVIHKLLRSRSDLNLDAAEEETPKTVVLPNDDELAKFDSDGEEKYEDVPIDDNNEDETVPKEDGEEGEDKEKVKGSSWHHAKLPKDEKPDAAASTISATKYDPYHRVPAFAGAEYAMQAELLMLMEHYHPTVQVFADSILNKKRIDYYGDPLRDFSLAHFLERFAFKNPKKLDKDAAEMPMIHSKRYVSYGARGRPVKSLTKANCTEDEMFIFNYLEKKRETAVTTKKKSDNDDDENPVGDVDDDEFEEYLDGFFGKKKKNAAGDEEEDEELDFLKELGGELKDGDDKKKKKKSKKEEEDEDEEDDDDWGDDGMDIDDIPEDHSEDEDGSIDAGDDDEDDDDDGGSISLDEGGSDENMSESGSDDDDEDDDDDDDDELKPPKSKKSRKSEKPQNFSKALKESGGDMSSLFAAADDFAELLEETGKTKGQGTSSAIYNKDKSSDKQMKWEEKRRSNSKNYIGKGKGKKFGKAGGGGGTKGAVKFGKKRKS